MQPITIRALQDQSREVANLFPKTTLEQRVMFLMTEVGEVAAELLYLTGAHGDIDTRIVKERLGLEIYDIVWNLCDLANMLGIDLEEAFARKIDTNRRRTWEEAEISA
jgi:NTP pyrophosphatase (non-canonical NTP hydrolase)